MIWMSHGTHVHESWHTYKWAMEHICVRHVSRMKKAWHTQLLMRHGTHMDGMNESWHTYEWGMSHIWMNHGTHMNEACLTYEWGMSHIWMSHGRHIRMCRGTHMYNIWETHSHSYVFSTYDTLNVSFIEHECVICRKHIWMRMCLSSYECVIWMRRVSFMNKSCRTHASGVPPIRMCHGTHMNESWHTHEWVMAHMNESCHTYECIMAHI